MTQEEKQLLIKDLCARLPYGVIVQVPENIFYDENNADIKLDAIVLIENNFHFTDDYSYTIEHVKPYLRPMSSMTEEEKVTYSIYHDNSQNIGYGLIDWLNKKMFDYRGLIEMGLALEAPEGMYNTKPKSEQEQIEELAEIKKKLSK